MKAPPGRVLAVDPGRVRVGLAVCDPLGIALTPAGVVPGGRKAAEEIARAAREQNVSAVVIGLPLNMDGSTGKEARKAALLASETASLLGPDMPVYLQDERLTSFEAQDLLAKADRKPSRNKALVDTLSAQLILRAFLDDLRAGKTPEPVSPSDETEKG